MDQTEDSYGAESANLRAALVKPRGIRFLSYFENILPRLSPGERLLLYILTVILAASTLVFLAGVNEKASVMVPVDGGSLTEGVIGSARFINPLLAISEADKDLSQLVYSGLTRVAPDGSIVPDLASAYEISKDGLSYTFTLRPNLNFHDGKPLTASDIIFTIHAAQNPDIRSMRRADWEGVTVTAPDEHTIVFSLPQSYAPFLENTTLGILPAHLWENISAEEFPFSPLNIKPIGSGPYKIANIETEKTGVATSYALIPFKNFALGAPHLKKITFLFFSNETDLVDAWNAGRIDSFAGVSSSELSRLEDTAHIVRASLPRVFGVFFNQGHAKVLANASVRAALDAAIDKEQLVNSVLDGYATPLDGPIPSGVLGALTVSKDTAASGTEESFNGAEEARAILKRGGWEFNEEAGEWQKGSKGEQKLSFVLATADSPELTATAQAVIAMWQAAGIHVELHVYPISELNTNIIRPRAYDAILFGEVVGRSLDLFAFWHSSQRNDPGLNLALYTNAKADTLLADARATTDRKEREALYNSFAKIIKEEQPAIFLFTPQFIYVLPEKVRGVELGALVTASERFLSVHEWYTDTERVWNIFTGIK